MPEGLILTAVGQDRPGIVDQLSGVVFREGCNLEDSRMAILGGNFAVIVLVTGAKDALGRLTAALPAIEEDLGLALQVRTTTVEQPQSINLGRGLLYRITAVAMDHPGIVHRISSILARNGINVAALDTRLTHAPTTGTPVFALTIDAQVPASLSLAELRALLERVADDENLDLEFHAIT